MEPQIRYVRSADGTNIATYSVGEESARPTLIYTPVVAGLGTLSSQWADTSAKVGIERIAEGRRVIWFDPRGSGLSDRTVEPSFEAWIADLDAVVAHSGERPVTLLGSWSGGPIVIAYAAREPARVSQLVLWNALIAGRDFQTPVLWRLTAPLADVDFEFFLQVRYLQAFGFNEGARVRAEAAKGQITPEYLRKAWVVVRGLDASSDLHEVRCPTLVVHQTEQEVVRVEVARKIAATVPGARLKLVRRTTGWPRPFDSHPEEDADILVEFLDPPAGPSSGASQGSGTAIILFADIVDSTALTERMGDAAFRERARALDEALRMVIRDHGGAAIDGKLLGDGVLATFPAAAQAIDAALRCAAAGDEQSFPLHLGLHAGDVIREENNVFGGAVNIASRISGLSAPGEVLVSDVVRALARTSASVTFEDRGEHALKGVGEAQRVYAVRASRSRDGGG